MKIALKNAKKNAKNKAKLRASVPENPEAFAKLNSEENKKALKLQAKFDVIEKSKPKKTLKPEQTPEPPKEKDYSKRMLSQERWVELQNGATPNSPYKYRAWVNGNPTRFRDLVAHMAPALASTLTVAGGGQEKETWFGKHAKAYADYKTRLAKLRETKDVELYKEGGLLALQSSDLKKKANETEAQFQERLTAIRADAEQHSVDEQGDREVSHEAFDLRQFLEETRQLRRNPCAKATQSSPLFSSPQFMSGVFLCIYILVHFYLD